MGPQACVECHQDKTKTQAQTLMAQAFASAESAEVLRKIPKLTVQKGPYFYEIIRQGQTSIYSVTDGKQKISVPIHFVVGKGDSGQTYLLRYKNQFYESRLSYYARGKELDFTIGQPPALPTSLEDALGRPVSPHDLAQCVGCHSSGAVAGEKIDFAKLIPGISCETCHGPGGEHIALSKAGKPSHEKIFNPGKLSADALSQDFCGSCHRSAENVMSLPQSGGKSNVRFQPYRIFGSKCYSDDQRISCTACHNSHEPMQKSVGYYDAKCTACHKAADSEIKLCNVSSRNCVSCHMPKTELEGAQYKFTDHRIRIVKPTEGYPF